MKKFFVAFLSLTLFGLVVYFSPFLLSNRIGAKMIGAILSQKFHGRVIVGNMEATWRDGVTFHNVNLQYEKPVSIRKIVWKEPLWRAVHPKLTRFMRDRYDLYITGLSSPVLNEPLDLYIEKEHTHCTIVSSIDPREMRISWVESEKGEGFFQCYFHNIPKPVIQYFAAGYGDYLNALSDDDRFNLTIAVTGTRLGPLALKVTMQHPNIRLYAHVDYDGEHLFIREPTELVLRNFDVSAGSKIPGQKTCIENAVIAIRPSTHVACAALLHTIELQGEIRKLKMSSENELMSTLTRVLTGDEDKILHHKIRASHIPLAINYERIELFPAPVLIDRKYAFSLAGTFDLLTTRLDFDLEMSPSAVHDVFGIDPILCRPLPLHIGGTMGEPQLAGSKALEAIVKSMLAQKAADWIVNHLSHNE
ncbi:MAG: hypothetical protein A3F09_04935 [Chlamydiae bacterium RIFCSPHIGHO2_12_FULL_49_11]|nr:MAG: hypothetical protein A3F09_04935 [Chlamydiae bacterium RIFCSPHIGHO2_12_FULL_49_11]